MEILDPQLTAHQDIRYAGFWIRVVAFIVDTIIVVIPGIAVQILLEYIYFENDLSYSPIAPVISISTLVIWNISVFVYFALMESSSRQRTLGKALVGLRVGDVDGRQLTFARALGKSLSKIISGSILGIGYVIVAFDPKKQSLHDKFANTFVFYR